MRQISALLPVIFAGLLALCASCNKEPAGIPSEAYAWESSSHGDEGMDAILLDSAITRSADRSDHRQSKYPPGSNYRTGMGPV